MRTTKCEGSRHTDVAFVETFQQPVCICLGDRFISHSLLYAVAHFGCMGSLDRILHFLDVQILISGYLIKRLVALQRRGQFIGGHTKHFCRGFQFDLHRPGISRPCNSLLD